MKDAGRKKAVPRGATGGSSASAAPARATWAPPTKGDSAPVMNVYASTRLTPQRRSVRPLNPSIPESLHPAFRRFDVSTFPCVASWLYV